MTKIGTKRKNVKCSFFKQLNTEYFTSSDPHGIDPLITTLTGRNSSFHPATPMPWPARAFHGTEECREAEHIGSDLKG